MPNFEHVFLQQPVSREDRETMGRLRNCIVALAEQKVLLYDTSIQYTYDASLKYEVCTWLVTLFDNILI